jgi:hypothetical protein
LSDYPAAAYSYFLIFRKGEIMKLLITVALAGLLSACGTTEYQGAGAGANRTDFSNSFMDCQRIAKKMVGYLDDRTTKACLQEKSDSPSGG